MHLHSRFSLVLVALTVVFGPAPAAVAGCGCDKPPPPHAAIRPFVAHPGQTVTIFDDGFEPGRPYRVEFHSWTGQSDWSATRAGWIRDLADRQKRMGLEVVVAPLPLGPTAVTVWGDDGIVLALTDEHLTVAGPPVELHEFDETIVQDGYQAAVGRDGTVYFPVDVGAVSQATTFVARAAGYPLRYVAENVVIYNEQGFLMQLLDRRETGLFEIHAGGAAMSDALEYWRHEFETYKRSHRRDGARGRGDGPDWHTDGTPHIDHDHLVVAIRGTLADGSAPEPGTTPAFSLELTSLPDSR